MTPPFVSKISIKYTPDSIYCLTLKDNSVIVTRNNVKKKNLWNCISLVINMLQIICTVVPGSSGEELLELLSVQCGRLFTSHTEKKSSYNNRKCLNCEVTAFCRSVHCR